MVLLVHAYTLEMYYISHMGDVCRRTAKSIRMKEDVYYRARVASVISRKSLGRWIEEAVEEKLGRENIPQVLTPQAGQWTKSNRSGGRDDTHNRRTEPVGRNT